MKLYFLYLLFLCNNLFAQSTLRFDKSYIECEDKWIAQPSEDSSYTFGFIYIDPQAGPTMHYGGNFKIAADGKFIPGKGLDISGTMKVRLEPSQFRVAIIPENKFTELQIPAIPDWLHAYKIDPLPVAVLYKRGYTFNEWDKPELALIALETAQQTDPNYPELSSELAYTYNALGKYEKALDVINDAKVKTCYSYKELTYALIKLGQLAEANTKCKEAMSVCNDKPMKAEIAFNLALEYYKIKDKANYTIWSNETKKWAEPNDRFSISIGKLDSKTLE